MTDAQSRYLAPVFDVQVIDNIVFGEAQNENKRTETLHLDVYLPENDPIPLRPAILWFHGGGFRPGNDKKQIYIPLFANAFASRGYVGIAPDYRLRADPMADLSGSIHDAVDDAQMALAWVRANCAAYRIDPTRIALAGGSAGGIVIVNLVHDTAQPVDAKRDGLFAILDMWGTPGEKFRLFDEANPNSPPTFIVHGTADAMVPYRWSQDFTNELQQAGVEPTLLTLPDAPHTPIRNHLDEIIGATADFLHKHLNDSSIT